MYGSLPIHIGAYSLRRRPLTPSEGHAEWMDSIRLRSGRSVSAKPSPILRVLLDSDDPRDDLPGMGGVVLRPQVTSMFPWSLHRSRVTLLVCVSPRPPDCNL